jgi:hypothetical protein
LGEDGRLLSRQRRVPCVALSLLIGFAAPVVVRAGVLDASWTAPTANDDGSPLTDLAWFKLYYGTDPAPCPGSALVIYVPAPTPAPSPDQIVTQRLTDLTTGTRYYAAVSAVTSAGMVSTCSPTGEAVARLDFAVTPSAPVDFGVVAITRTLDGSFTVQNTGGGTVSGTVTTSSPFSIVGGDTFSIVGAGTAKTVTVRFSPTAAASVTANVTFTANGGSVTRIVSGTGVPLNPVPTLTALSPSTALAGGSELTLTLTGTGFVPTSSVSWDGAPRPTTYMSSTQLTAIISASDLASVGKVAVKVTSPAPGGGTSKAITFTIKKR